MSLEVDISISVRGDRPLTLAEAKEALVKLAIELVDADKIEAIAQMLVDASRERIAALGRRPQHRAHARRAHSKDGS
jgi:hypothetical protein